MEQRLETGRSMRATIEMLIDEKKGVLDDATNDKRMDNTPPKN